jgi:hypothetical protein
MVCIAFFSHAREKNFLTISNRPSARS